MQATAGGSRLRRHRSRRRDPDRRAAHPRGASRRAVLLAHDHRRRPQRHRQQHSPSAAGAPVRVGTPRATDHELCELSASGTAVAETHCLYHRPAGDPRDPAVARQRATAESLGADQPLFPVRYRMVSPGTPDRAGSPQADLGTLLSEARVWEQTGYVIEARAAYDRVIAGAMQQRDSGILAEALRRRAVLVHQAGDSVAAEDGLQQSYAVARLAGDQIRA